MSGSGKSWVEVREERLRGNFAELRRAAGVAVLAVVKADAYGHGAALCAPVLADAGAGWMGVTDAAEGVLVRSALREATRAASRGGDAAGEPEVGILVMCGMLEEDADVIVARGLTPVVWTVRQMEWMVAAVRRQGGREGGRARLAVHVEVDTGMSRQGVRPGADLGEVMAWLHESKELRMGGVLTHFASAEVVGSRQTAEQRGRFAEAVEMVRAAGLAPEWVHAGNTSGVDNPEAVVGRDQESLAVWLGRMAVWLGAKPIVRSGLGLYGYSLELEAEVAGQEGGLRLAAAAAEREAVRPVLGAVRPVMTWKTRVIAVSEIGAGMRVGYNGTFRARGPMRLALLPVGYADGLRRELSGGEAGGGGWVMVRGRRAAVVGRVSMNLTTVDVTGIAGVSEGDEVVLLGEGVTAEDHARMAGTIAYEILCGVRAAGRVLV